MQYEEFKIRQKTNDGFVLSPMQLQEKYGKFPWDLLFHLLLIILTTSQIMLLISDRTEYTRQQEHLFYNLFLENSAKNEVNDYSRLVYLYSIPELKEHLVTSLNVKFCVYLEFLQY
jgi:hypothetical protein